MAKRLPALLPEPPPFPAGTIVQDSNCKRAVVVRCDGWHCYARPLQPGTNRPIPMAQVWRRRIDALRVVQDA